jgi:hypothetical protein
MKLTDKEESILGLIPEDDFFQNGKESILWTDVFVEMAGTRTGLSNQAVGGVLSALSRKGLVAMYVGIDPGTQAKSDNGLWLTDKGAELLNIDD